MSADIPGYGVYYINITTTDETGEFRLTRSQDDTQISAVELPVDADEDDPCNKWIVYPVSASEGSFVLRITNFDGTRILSCQDGDLEMKSVDSANTTWNIASVRGSGTTGLLVTTDEEPEHYVKWDTEGSSKFLTTLPAAGFQGGPPRSDWKFERVVDEDDHPCEVPPELAWSGAQAADGESFQRKFFHLTPKEAAWEEYDYIIVGTGIGGGVLANDLYDTNFRLGKKAKRILLLEKGGLVFHSHCLNTARPAGLMNDRGQQNDTFFKNFKRNYKFHPPLQNEPKFLGDNPPNGTQFPWSGGPMYNLGGRSAAWGLFSPRVHDVVLSNNFYAEVAEDLRREYYDKAERLMLLSLPTTRRGHQHIMDRLNSKCREIDQSGKVQWQWGRIASEFKDDENFDFAEGAYSSIDKILEIAMSRPKGKDANDKEVLIEHKYFKTVLDADVRSLALEGPAGDRKVTGVNVKVSGHLQAIKLRENGKVILCAGSVGSPAILLRSELEDKLKEGGFNALHLTDHTVVFFQWAFRYTNPAKRSEYGAMKLQSHAEIDGKVVLLNMSIDASSFLPRGKSPDEALPKFIMVFMLQQELVQGNSIELANDEPQIKLQPRGRNHDHRRMRQLTLAAMKALVGSAGIEFTGDFRNLKEGSEETDFIDKIHLGLLPLGGVAHELGTLPMRSRDASKGYCLDENLAVRDELCKGAYVCDLSCLPHSPEANPTLTLAALAIRLSRYLSSRLTVGTMAAGTVYAVNHSGSKVKVFLSNHQPNLQANVDPQPAEQAEILEPGDAKTWLRQEGVPQALLVYKLDRSENPQSEYLTTAVLLEAHPGKLTPILPG
ncbi:hypothetical protein FRC11_006310 [Ceratobasidium sp. 423]|nr:hypothetical protein FRC11_006310 [Ceratobasidium sp. 423]